ncbi:putative ribonuclease H-like domain-containing protein [Tanacetum coccineum]
MFHSKTKHIEIRHHFIRDSYEKRLIQVIKIHTDHNVTDLLTKAFDSSGPTTLVADETVYKEREDRMERASTTASSLEAEQDSGNILRTQSMEILNEPIPQGTSSGSGPKRQDTILGDRPAQTRFERLSKQSNDLPLSRVNTLGSGEDSMKLNELMEIYTKLSDKVFDLENVKDAQALEIKQLKKRVKKMEKRKKSRTPQLKRRLFKVRIKSSAEKSLETQGRYRISTAGVTTASVSVTTLSPIRPVDDSIIDDITLAETLMKIKSSASRPQKAKEVQKIREKMQAEFEEEERVARQREKEANLISWDNTQAMIEADYELAQRLQAEEQGELTIEERSKLFVELMNKRKKHFANFRAEEIRRKPQTKAQKRNQMCTYLKHMAGYKHTQLKNKIFEEIQMLFEKSMKWIDSFVPMDLEVVEGSGKKAESNGKKAVSKKRAGEKPSEESVKRQKLEDDAEKAELKACLEIVPKDNEAVNVESLATKYQ